MNWVMSGEDVQKLPSSVEITNRPLRFMKDIDEIKYYSKFENLPSNIIFSQEGLQSALSCEEIGATVVMNS